MFCFEFVFLFVFLFIFVFVSFFTCIGLHLYCFVLVLFWICIVVYLYYFESILFCINIILDLFSCIFVFAGELKFRKEKRVKKPLQIACNGQYYQNVDVIMINMVRVLMMSMMFMRMWLI